MIARSDWGLVAGWLILTVVTFYLALPTYEHLLAVAVWMLYSVGVGVNINRVHDDRGPT